MSKFTLRQAQALLLMSAALLVQPVSGAENAARIPSNQCSPQPMPFTLLGMEIRILQEPEQVTILYNLHNQVRRIRLNQPHPPRVTASWHGNLLAATNGIHAWSRP